MFSIFFFFFNFEFILFSVDRNSIGINITLITALWLCRTPVRVKGGMCLWNGMWHGLRNDIIMQNVIYADCLKEIIRLKSAPFFGANQFSKSTDFLTFFNVDDNQKPRRIL